MAQYLEFEKPIEELLEQIEETRKIGEKSDVDMSQSIEELEKKLEKTKAEIYGSLSPWQRVLISRHPDRPYTLDYFNHLTDGDFIELHGDRNVKDDKAIVGGLGSIDG